MWQVSCCVEGLVLDPIDGHTKNNVMGFIFVLPSNVKINIEILKLGPKGLDIVRENSEMLEFVSTWKQYIAMHTIA